MKKYTMIGIAAAAVLCSVAIAVAQAKQHSRHEHGMLGQRMAQKLGLTDAQQKQIKGILQAEKPKIQPLMQQLRQERQQMNTLTVASTFDESAVRASAGKEAQTLTDLAVERARVKSQIFAVLTPDQRTQALAMEKNFGAGRHGRSGHGKAAGSATQPGADS